MNIKIIRNKISKDVIDGQIYIDGMHICDCAENANSVLKAGTYPVVIIKCKQHGRKMPVILPSQGNSLDDQCKACKKLHYVCNNTPMPCVCPQLCPGNGVNNRTDGAIIVGKHVTHGCLSHPQPAFYTLYQRIRKNIERGHDVTLVIEERYQKPQSKELSNFEMGIKILVQLGGKHTNH